MNALIIGLTGGIASGKSTVSQLLVKHGALLVDADQVAREIVEPGEPALAEIVSCFGQAVLQEDGSLNRAQLGSIVFADHEKLKKLEAITHPAIRKKMVAKMNHLQDEYPEKMIIADIPLLYETKQEHLYDGILVVYVPEATQMQRLMERNQLSEQEARARIKLQMNIELKRERADWVIDNTLSLEETEAQVVSFLQEQGKV